MEKFIDKSKLTRDQLTDPDYALRQIEYMNKEGFIVTVCSKCHHCR